MRPAQFPSVLGDDCPEACTALGLEPYETGYGPPGHR
ncbi:integral membrane protein [Streptomyces malaysiensis subsp. malaysiensis]|nr:integral membrane protein [Streptomyces malaysiensis]